MIERLWHGWTDPGDADGYERLLREEILPEAVEGIDGCHGARVLRRDADGEVEFVTSIRFGSMGSVREFAGEDHETAHVPPEARELLSRFDDRVRHYEVRAETGENGSV